MVDFALSHDGPTSIRYPKANVGRVDRPTTPIELGKIVAETVIGCIHDPEPLRFSRRGQHALDVGERHELVVRGVDGRQRHASSLISGRPRHRTPPIADRVAGSDAASTSATWGARCTQPPSPLETMIGWPPRGP